MKSQNEMIKEHLEKGKSLTALEALAKYHCFRLSARIANLRDQGLNIKTEMIETNSGKRVAQYKLG